MSGPASTYVRTRRNVAPSPRSSSLTSRGSTTRLAMGRVSARQTTGALRSPSRAKVEPGPTMADQPAPAKTSSRPATSAVSSSTRSVPCPPSTRTQATAWLVVPSTFPAVRATPMRASTPGSSSVSRLPGPPSVITTRRLRPGARRAFGMTRMDGHTLVVWCVRDFGTRSRREVRPVLEVVLRETRALVAGLDVDPLSGVQARELAAGFAELERLAAAGKLLATGRLVASGAGPGDDSFRDVDAWLASVSGTTVGSARATAKAATRALEQPVVESAVRTGQLSAVQAELVTTAV